MVPNPPLRRVMNVVGNAGLFLVLATAACTTKNSSAPGLSGPSGFATTITMTAIPDTITQDGASQASVAVNAIDASGKPLGGLAIRLDMSVGGVTQDFGTLSARTIVTGADGRANAVYTAPAAPPPSAGGSGTRVTIIGSPTGSNSQASSVGRTSVAIKLMPPGVILPPAGTPIASFFYSPTSVTSNSAVHFDASASSPGEGAASITSYSWSFGDGATGSGKAPNHSFTIPNVYSVTLTVTNDRGLSASTTQSIAVGVGTGPTADFVFSPSNPTTNQSVFFDASASKAAPGHNIVSYSWEFGDISTGSGVTKTHSYTSPGSYAVTLTVRDDAGQRSTATKTVTVGTPSSTAPTASFTFSPLSPTTATEVFFNATASTPGAGHTIASYAWDFGDGTLCPASCGSGSGATPTHTFAAAGSYVVTLLVTDNIGQKASTTRVIAVSAPGNAAPTAAFTFSPQAPTAGANVFFNASSSTAGAGHTIATYAWDFGDSDTCLPTCDPAGVNPASPTLTPNHKYAAAGTYTVTLVVTDDIGQTANVSHTVTVAPAGQGAPPTAAFTFSPSAPGIAETVFFNASASTGSSALQYSWTFGDGTTCPLACGTGGVPLTPNHAYSVAGTYTVTLTVTDATNRMATTQQTVTVGNPPGPKAIFVFSPASPGTFHQIVFDASQSTIAQGHPITNYAWVFGDGTTSPVNGSPLITHTYTVPGTYNVTLTVTDNASRTDTAAKAVTVDPVPLAAFTIDTSATPTIGFNASTSLPSPGATSISTYAWDFGDGTAPGFGVTQSHPYANPGTYTVTLTVTDNLARVDSVQHQVVVP